MYNTYKCYIYIYTFISYHIIDSYIIYINIFINIYIYIFIDMQDQIVQYFIRFYYIYIIYHYMYIYNIGLYRFIYILYISYHVICSVYIICIC